MNKKILFIGSDIFFGNSVGGFRQDRWMKAFLNESFDCYAIDSGSFLPKYYNPKSYEAYSEFRINVRTQKQNKASVREGVIIDVLRKIKHFFIFEVFNPINLFQVFYLSWKLRKEKFDFIFASSPPFSSAAIAYLYKKYFSNAKLIIDFRDQWANHPYIPQTAIINKRVIQKKILNKTDFVITVSNFISENIDFKNVLVIYNAPDINYQSELNMGAIKLDNKIEIIYTGSLPAKFYDCKQLAVVLNLIKSKFENITFSFLGACYELEKEKCPSNTIFFEQKTLKMSRKMQNKSDILLFMAARFASNGGIVSSKIFEYIQSEKPILPLFVQEGSDVYHIIKESCGWCPCLNSIEEIMEIFEKINIYAPNEVLPSLKNKGFLDKLLNEYPKFAKKLNDI